MFSLVFLCYRFLSLARLTPRWSCAGLRLSKNFRFHFSSPPLPFRKRVQKYYLFPIPQALFSTIFPLFHISLVVNGKNITEDGKHGGSHTLVNIMMRHQRGKNASSTCPITGSPSLETMETRRLVAAFPSLTEKQKPFGVFGLVRLEGFPSA